MRRLPTNDVQYMRDLIDAAEIGAKRALEQAGLSRSEMSFREAAKRWGTATVNRWHSEGLISFNQDGPNTKKRIDRLQIEAVAKASNRASFMAFKEQ